MFLRPRKKTTQLSDKVRQESRQLKPEFQEVFFGRNTLFTLLGSIIGGVMVGNAVSTYTSQAFGQTASLILGLALFIMSGILSKAFKH